MSPTGSSAGAPRTPEERADTAWLREVAAAAIAARPAHQAMVLDVGGDYFRAWCSTCSRYVSPRGKDKQVQKFRAESHQRKENHVA